MDTRTLKNLLTPIAAALATWPAMAQTTGDTSTGTQVVEVTASKRKQLVIDVPYSITAIGGSEIADRGVTDIQQMQSVVPSLFINQNAPGASRIQLRGLSQGVGYGAALVGTYLDEISLNMPDAQRSLDVPLVDRARIEVLRGQQGTLYGDGSMGGTIRFITRAPRLDQFEGSVEAGFSQVSGGQTGWRANGVVNVPLSTGVAGLRLVAGHEDLPGWVDNSASGAKDINSAKRDFLRGKLLVKPSANGGADTVGALSNAIEALVNALIQRMAKAQVESAAENKQLREQTQRENEDLLAAANDEDMSKVVNG
jgi:outer membrane receptor protein involved in Fe transport